MAGLSSLACLSSGVLKHSPILNIQQCGHTNSTSERENAESQSLKRILCCSIFNYTTKVCFTFAIHNSCLPGYSPLMILINLQAHEANTVSIFDRRQTETASARCVVEIWYVNCLKLLAGLQLLRSVISSTYISLVTTSNSKEDVDRHNPSYSDVLIPVLHYGVLQS